MFDYTRISGMIFSITFIEFVLSVFIRSISVAPDNSVGNPCDQMTKCTEFVTIFSSAPSRIF